MMQDFHEDDDYEDGSRMSRCALGAVICLAVLALMLAAGLLAG